MKKIVLGIDCGGTHTDAALIEADPREGKARVLASYKTETNHDNLVSSIAEVASSLRQDMDDPSLLKKTERVSIGSTLAVNALVQDRADKVGLALSAGSGLDPSHFAIGDLVCVVPGGLDHRGSETGRLFLDELEREARAWPEKGAAAVACVGKFSPRNPAHENKMGEVAARASGLPATLGHRLSGKLNFPRRIATAYYNAAVQRLHSSFLDACEAALKAQGISGQYRLLKADGGAIPFPLSRREAAQSILSGPAASVMGAQALWSGSEQKCALLLDMGGTTTDIALFLDGSPVLDRHGMTIKGRRTLVRSLAAASIGVGGDSSLTCQTDSSGKKKICAGPLRIGSAMAFGGAKPTLLDALNVLNEDGSAPILGDAGKSREGVANFAEENGFDKTRLQEIAALAVEDGLNKIVKAVYDLVETVNSGPIHTLADLKARKDARPIVACLVGGPASCVRRRLSQALGMPIEIPSRYEVANAIGAALAVPTASLEVYADTGKGELYAPTLNYRAEIPASLTLDQLKNIGRDLLREKLREEGMDDGRAEVVEADLFATLDDRGRGSRDLRVVCQARPGILGRIAD
ncbi:MAG: hydantoinase/oxoprolinase family protein [Desulfovibrio sp.]|nr:hydantoinase/oxoprolinase family protein [Desulfovibrio sp.]